KTQRWCFVPGCDAGYKSCGIKLSLFRAPKDAATFEKWARAIPRTDNVLQENSAVCERHFDDRFIVRAFRHQVNGQEVLVPRDVPILTEDAFPTVFPNLPKYIMLYQQRRTVVQKVKPLVLTLEHGMGLVRPPFTKHLRNQKQLTLLHIHILKYFQCLQVVLSFMIYSVLQIKTLPQKQQSAVRACFEASKRKSLRGYRYSKQWLLECIILRMKGPRLYEHLRRHKVLVLPSRVCLFTYIKQLLNSVKVKVQGIDDMKRHGGLVLDEMKLSSHLDMIASARIEGFVDLGQFTEEADQHTRADHGLVVMFQPFVGRWTQIIGVFASSGNVKSGILTEIVVEETLLCEKVGLRVDYICSDGASWNRAMWHALGIHGTSTSVTCKVVHPADEERHLYFVSDFPHLVKCVRNLMMKHGFNTHEGRAHWEHVSTTWKCDNNNVTCKVAHKLTRAHIFPDGFQKMRVNLAFQIFSSSVVRAMSFHEEKIEAQYPNLKPTKLFVNLMADLVVVMTSRFPAQALRPGSKKAAVLDETLQFLDAWEAHAGKLGFLSNSTAEGLRVSLHATKDLLAYLTEKVGFSFLMISRLSQDCLERCFGIVRQSCGANGHPTPAQFIVVMRCLAFYGLARSPKGGNVEPDMLESLLSVEEVMQDDGEDDIWNSGEPLSSAEVVIDHAAYVAQHSDSRLVYYIAGYVEKQRVVPSSCGLCKSLCLLDKNNVPANLPSEACMEWDLGGLLYPSEAFYALIQTLEDRLTRTFSQLNLHTKAVKETVHGLGQVPSVGCSEHSHVLTMVVVKFYCLTRIHFFLKGLNQTANGKKGKEDEAMCSLGSCTREQIL
ncbi:hypothetical protein HPB47_012294, partial [Ixodes persulcatus]